MFEVNITQNVISQAQGVIMDNWSDQAQLYLHDWNAWNWLIVSILLLISALLPYFVIPLGAAVENWPTWSWMVLGLSAGLCALWCLFALPGALLRRVPDSGNLWWVVVPCAAAIFVLAATWLLADGSSRWLFLVPSAALLVGLLVGLFNDWLQRRASEFPTSVATLVGLAIVASAAFIWHARSPSR